jgi:penicillin-binding protein 1A
LKKYIEKTLQKVLSVLRWIKEKGFSFFKRSKKEISDEEKKKKHYILERYLIGILAAFTLIWSFVVGLGIYQFQNLEDIEALSDYSLYEVPTALYDIKGRKITEFYLYKREIIAFKNVPETMIRTLMTAEDRNFFDHGGVDYFGIIRAMIANLKAGEITQGGSTLTQQLAKLLFTNRERTIARKLKELWLTYQIEKKYTKEEILEKYLNKVYYGNNQYGLKAAADFYLGKEAENINYADSAFLVSIPPAPSYLNPLKYPLRTKKRQKRLLGQLVEAGYLSQSRADREFKQFWIHFQERLISGAFHDSKFGKEDRAPYFSEYIRRILYEKFSDKIYTGGYKVYTTIDIDKQERARQLLKEKLKEQKEFYRQNTQRVYRYVQDEFKISNIAHPRLLEFLALATQNPNLRFYESEVEDKVYRDLVKNDILSWIPAFASFNMNTETLMLEKKIQQQDDFQLGYVPEGALVSIEVETGRILSMVGGSGYTPFNQLNRAYQSRRQPGSAFKPFVYLTALLSKQFTPASLVNDIPLAYEIEDGEVWTPSNAGRTYHGRIRLRTALRKSINIVSIRLIEALGIEPVVNLATKVLGLPHERFRKDYSLSLGTSELSPLELATGYSILANMGKEVDPHAIVRVEDRYGKIIWNPEKEIFEKEKEQIVPPEYVFILIDMMKDVIQRGTGSRAAYEAGFHYPAAGKTGTSSNLRDAWFSGFTPHVATAVWVGFDKGITLGPGQYGGRVAGPVWMKYMKYVMEDYPKSDFKRPAGVNKVPIHQATGLRLSDSCQSELREKYFKELEEKGLLKEKPEKIQENEDPGEQSETEDAEEGEEKEEAKEDGVFREYFISGTEPEQESNVCGDETQVSEEEMEKIKLFE